MFTLSVPCGCHVGACHCVYLFLCLCLRTCTSIALRPIHPSIHACIISHIHIHHIHALSFDRCVSRVHIVCVRAHSSCHQFSAEVEPCMYINACAFLREMCLSFALCTTCIHPYIMIHACMHAAHALMRERTGLCIPTIHHIYASTDASTQKNTHMYAKHMSV